MVADGRLAQLDGVAELEALVDELVGLERDGRAGGVDGERERAGPLEVALAGAAERVERGQVLDARAELDLVGGARVGVLACLGELVELAVVEREGLVGLEQVGRDLERALEELLGLE